jgi:hypothetical protein
MLGAIIKCIPLMIGAALTPVCIMIVFLLLRSEGGFIKAVAFVAGQFVVRLMQGLVFGYEFVHSVVARANAPTVVSTGLLLAGIFLWFAAAQNLRKEADPDGPSPKWLSTIHTASTRRIFMMSAIWMAISPKQWIFTLGALGIITVSNLHSPVDIFTYIIFILGAQSLMLGPIVIASVNPNQSSRIIDVSSAWVERYNRRIVIVISAVFGGYFFYKGFTGLFVNI